MVFEGLLCRGFAICRMIFDFIIKCLTAQATKTVILGPQTNEKKNVEEKELSWVQGTCVDIGSSTKIEEKIEPKVEVQVKKVPKKMVSINENAEVIYPSKDKRKRKRSFDKLPSIDEQKPIKSILKVGSNLTREAQE